LATDVERVDDFAAPKGINPVCWFQLQHALVSPLVVGRSSANPNHRGDNDLDNFRRWCRRRQAEGLQHGLERPLQT